MFYLIKDGKKKKGIHMLNDIWLNISVLCVLWVFRIELFENAMVIY